MTPTGKLQIAGSHTAGIITDGNDRPSVGITGTYPQVVLMSGNSGNGNHGSTIMLGGYDAGASGAHKHWSIGTAGSNSTFLDIGYHAGSSLNPHAGIRNYDGSTFMTILNSGNVGLGTTGPLELMELYKAGGGAVTRIHSPGISEYKIGIGTGTSQLRIMNTNGNTALQNETRGLAIDTVGNVGIGLTNPVGKLQVGGVALANPIMADGNDRPSIGITGIYPQLVLFGGGSGNTNHGATFMIGSYNAGTSGASQHWSIGTAGNGSSFLDIGYSGNNDMNPHAGIRNYNGTTVMTLLNNGNVGIGTLGPAAKLHISSGDALALQLGPNASWGATLRLGGWFGDTSTSGIRVSDGNLHMDSQGGHGMYLNYFSNGWMDINNGGGSTTIHNNLTVANGKTAISRDNMGECCSGGNYTLSLAEATNSTGRLASIEFHNAGYHEGYLRLSTADGGPRRIQMGDNQGAGMALDLQGGLYFTKTNLNHTGYGNNGGFAAIENTANYNTLMILGRSGGIGGGRSVSIWDRLDVNGYLQVNGTAYVTSTMTAASFACASDERLKKNVKPITNALDKVQRLDGVTFNWKQDGSKGLGLTAQNVEKVLPELVVTLPDGIKAVKYDNMVALLIEAVKEQNKQIEHLEEQIAALKGRKRGPDGRP